MIDGRLPDLLAAGAERLLALPRMAKRALVLGLDFLLVWLSTLVAFWLRLGEWVDPWGVALSTALLACLLALPIFAGAGLYRAIFRHTGGGMLLAISGAVMLYALPFAAVVGLVVLPGVPRTIGVIQPLVLLAGLAGSRVLFASLVRRCRLGARRPGVLIYGAGNAGRQLAAAIRASHECRVAGFIDDDPRLRGAVLDGVKIHSPSRLALLAQRHGVAEVLLAIPSASAARRQAIVEQVRALGLTVRTLPAVLDVARGTVALADLRPIAIEDLLTRPPVAPDPQLLRANVAGRVVLVSGAGGSIGGELCRQILRLGPARLLLVEHGEHALYAVHDELLGLARSLERDPEVLVPLLASVVDERAMAAILAAFPVETIFHAAAYKHVPLVEHNIIAGVRNNVIGTRVLAGLAARAGVRNFVLISTDKAVRPTNVMGASKRLAELVVQAEQECNPHMRLCMVRFGNVLGSSGSVVPRFCAQVAAGGPVTVTHPDITRFFMTIPEAAQLVLQASAMARGGDVMVLDMGEPVKVLDLARTVIRLCGRTVRDANNPSGQIPIVFTGLRPGEKLYEETLIGANPLPTAHPRILRAQEPFVPMARLRPALVELGGLLQAGDAAGVRRLLARLVEDYRPEPQMVDLLAKAGGAIDAAHASVLALPRRDPLRG